MGRFVSSFYDKFKETNKTKSQNIELYWSRNDDYNEIKAFLLLRFDVEAILFKISTIKAPPSPPS